MQVQLPSARVVESGRIYVARTSTTVYCRRSCYLVWPFFTTVPGILLIKCSTVALRHCSPAVYAYGPYT